MKHLQLSLSNMRQKTVQTTISLDDKLLQEASLYASTNNPDELIQLALYEFIHNHRTQKPKYQKRRLGLDKGRFTIPEDFDAVDTEIEKAFYGE